MKKLLMLLVVPCLMAAQPLTVQASGSENYYEFFFKVADTTGGVPRISSEVRNRTIAATSTDTVQAIYLVPAKTFYLTIAASETCTVLIDYALSVDGVNYTAFTLKDSLSHRADGYGVKTIDLTSTILGAPFARFRFRGTAGAYVFGTSSTPKYWAAYTIKRF